MDLDIWGVPPQHFKEINHHIPELLREGKPMQPQNGQERSPDEPWPKDKVRWSPMDSVTP